MSKVAFTWSGGMESRGSGVIGSDGRLPLAWLYAMRLIMLRVLPRPISSAKRPPWKLGGASLELSPLTLFLYLNIAPSIILIAKSRHSSYLSLPKASLFLLQMSRLISSRAQPFSRRTIKVKAFF